MQKRRGNKSHKVPNVKLRPAQRGALSRHGSENSSTIWAEESQLGSDDAAFDSCPRPFKNVVICVTGMLDKPTIHRQATELGAHFVSSLTDRVTHLVAEEHGGAKYDCALQRRMPIMTAAWITESYDVWLRGDDVDMEESVKNYRLPIFSGVILCISGIEDDERRKEIQKKLIQEKGVFIKNLERPVKVTHLLCSGDTDTEKMIYAEKFNARGEADIHLVWEDWFWDSIHCGGQLNEKRYNIRRPKPVKNPNEENPPASTAPSSSAEEPPSSAPTRPGNNNNTQSINQGDDEEELVSCKRVPKMALQLQHSLLKQRGFEITDGALQLSPKRSQQAAQYERPPSPIAQPDFMRSGGRGADSVISAFRRTKSLVVEAPPNAEASSSRGPFTRAVTISGVFKTPLPPQPEAVKEPNVDGEDNASASAAMFAGMNFRLLGEARTPSVRAAIEECGGKIVPEGDDDVDVHFIIVRIVTGSKFYTDEEDENERAKYRTECWLERCIFEEKICPAEDHVAYAPLKIQVPLLYAEKVHLIFSGLDQWEQCVVRRLGRAFGFDIPKGLTTRTTHLLCPSGEGAKFEQAQKWGIPVVGMTWLFEMATSGLVPAAADHIVGGAAAVDEEPERPAMEVDQMHVDIPRVDKGKGKAKDSDSPIQDITNSNANSQEPDNGAWAPGSFLMRPEPTSESAIRRTTSEPSDTQTSGSGRSKGMAAGKGHDPTPQRSMTFASFGRPGGIQAESSVRRSVRDRDKLRDETVLPPHGDVSMSFKSLGHSNGIRAQSSFQRPGQEDEDESDMSFGLDHTVLPPNHIAEGDSADTEDDDGGRVPSSATPSPLKMPPELLESAKRMQAPALAPAPVPKQRPLPPSPTTPSKGAAALQRSVDSMLGKRSSLEGDEIENDVDGAMRDVRPGKRLRPRGVKGSYSVSSISMPPPVFDPGEQRPILPPDFGAKPAGEEDRSIMYDDPRQREENDRLRSLLCGRKEPVTRTQSLSVESMTGGGATAAKRKRVRRNGNGKA